MVENYKKNENYEIYDLFEMREFVYVKVFGSVYHNYFTQYLWIFAMPKMIIKRLNLKDIHYKISLLLVD